MQDLGDLFKEKHNQNTTAQLQPEQTVPLSGLADALQAKPHPHHEGCCGRHQHHAHHEGCCGHHQQAQEEK